MIFAPVTQGSWDCHIARVSSFVVVDQSSIGATGKKVGLLVFGESGGQLLLVSTGTNAMQKPDRPATDPFFHGIEMGWDRTFHEPKMRQIEFRWIDRANFLERFKPGFDVKFGRDEWRNRRSIPEAYACNIATE